MKLIQSILNIFIAKQLPNGYQVLERKCMEFIVLLGYQVYRNPCNSTIAHVLPFGCQLVIILIFIVKMLGGYQVT